MENIHQRRITRRQLARTVGIAAAAIGVGREWQTFRVPSVQAHQKLAETRTRAVATQLDESGFGFRALLDAVPEPFSGSETSTIYLQFLDVAAQFAAVGRDIPTALSEVPDSDWVDVTETLLGISFYDAMRVLGDAWRETFGFDYLQVGQFAVLNPRDFPVTVLRGVFDPTAIEAAWLQSGYVPLGDGVYSLFPETPNEQVIDFTNPTSAMVGVGEVNNAAMIGTDTIIFGMAAESVRMAIGRASGANSSLSDRPEMRALLDAMESPLASGAIVEGRSFAVSRSNGNSHLPATDREADDALTAELGSMPALRQILAGVTPGGPVQVRDNEGNALQTTPVPGQPMAAFELAVLCDDPGSAERAAAIITRRSASFHSRNAFANFTEPPLFADVFPIHSIAAVTGTSVVRIRLHPREDIQSYVWRYMFENGDLSFLFWIADDDLF